MKKLIVILILLSSCSVQKRCERHLKKATQFGCLKLTNDTIVKTDTLRGFRVDTVVQYHNEIDTLLVDSGGIKSITIIRWKDKIVSQTITKKDTILKTKYVNKTKTVYLEKSGNVTKWWHYIIFAAMLLAILIILIKK